MDESVPLEEPLLNPNPPIPQFDLKKKMSSLAIKFSSLRTSYNGLRKKLVLQNGKACTINLIAKLHFIEEEVDKAQESMEEAMAELDAQGHWQLSQEDIDRILAINASQELFREFLPQMIKHRLADDKAKGISKICVIL